MIDCEVGLHGAQLMMLEGGAHAFGARRGAHVAAATEVHVFGVEICGRRVQNVKRRFASLDFDFYSRHWQRAAAFYDTTRNNMLRMERMQHAACSMRFLRF